MDESIDFPDHTESQFATSFSLLQRAREHDQHAWKCLTELYAPLIYHWCRRSGMKGDDAVDLIQDVFRSLVTHLKKFEKTSEQGSFRAWLWTITRNRIRDHFRAASKGARAQGGSEARLLIENIPEQEWNDNSDSVVTLAGSVAYRALDQVRSEVKETTWLAFWRTTIDEVSPAAVAEELEVSIETVWQAKSRIMRRLRELLE